MVVDTLRLTFLGLALAVSAVFTVSAQTTGASSKVAPSAADIKARRAERLELVVANQLEIEEAMVVVYEAVHARDRDAISLLKRVAAVAAVTRRYTTVGLMAVRGLRDLGEPRAYFYERIRDYESNPRLAGYCATVLASEPDDEVLAELKPVRDRLRRIIKNGEDGSWSAAESGLPGAIDTATFVRYRWDRYAEMADVNRKTFYLIENMGSGCLVWSAKAAPLSDWEDRAYGQDPIRVWARNELRALSEREPRAVAAAVFALKADQEPGKRILMNCPYKPYGPADFRAYVGLFLSDDARLTLEQLQTKARLKRGAQRSHVGRP